ncbi:Hypothetical predicted protein [Paramuricea clavata]|uniref:Uncharacterized protein n=1 Tax=Paramuricea clavata TaxID=317549 RepID=A0A6S7G3Z1_PARCT|nr:Hypothetical predicted protein [Paramuricea clavata]
MGSSFSTNPTPQEHSLSLALVQYDTQKANAAIQHTNSDFVDPHCLVNTLLPGDMIQKKGNFILQWFYSHFAIYIGNGEIVHATIPNNQMYGKCFIARAIMVNEFSSELVRKNNHLDNAVGFQIQPLHHIVQTARGQVGQPWDYNFITHNCEHFTTWCRYGREVSLQSWGIGDLISGKISLGEYVAHSVYSIKEKATTFWSWFKRKTVGIYYSIG